MLAKCLKLKLKCGIWQFTHNLILIRMLACRNYSTKPHSAISINFLVIETLILSIWQESPMREMTKNWYFISWTRIYFLIKYCWNKYFPHLSMLEVDSMLMFKLRWCIRTKASQLFLRKLNTRSNSSFFQYLFTSISTKSQNRHVKDNKY